MKHVKPVSFNDTDSFEVRMLAHIARQGKFATYIKRLITRDMGAPVPAIIDFMQEVIPQQKAPVVVDVDEDMFAGMR